MEGGSWRVCVGMSNFLVTTKNTVGPGWSSAATAGTTIGLTNLVQLSLHFSDLCGSSLILDLQVKKCRIVVPGKIEGSGSGCQDISILLLINSNSKEICLVFQIFQQLKKKQD